MATGKAAAVPSLSQLHNATGYVREATALCFILSVSAKRQPQTASCVGAYAAPSCIGCIVVTVQRYEETFECPNIFAIISYIGMENLKTYGLTTGISLEEPLKVPAETGEQRKDMAAPSAGGASFLLGRAQHLLDERLFRVLCRQRQPGNDTALHREPRLKGQKRAITLRHSSTRLKTTWFSGAVL
jgi:hypothetical protein